MSRYRISLVKNPPSAKYTWKQKIESHINIAKAKYTKHFVGETEVAKAVSDEPISDYDNDIGYYGPATIDGQKFQLLFDTGSSDLWIPKVGYNNNAHTTHNVFDPKKSPTFKTDNKPFSITYGSGNTSGIIATDTYKFADFTINKQVFGLSDKVSKDFDRSPFDGILGLGLDQLNTLNAPTPFQNLVNNGDVTSPVFSFLLGREKDGTKSEFVVGGVDPKYESKISYSPLNSKIGFWQIALDDAHVNNQSLHLKGKSAIIDTGTTLVIIPPHDAATLHKAIPGSVFEQGYYLIPTKTSVVVSLTFGGTTYHIKTEDLVVYDAGNGLSVSGIQGGDVTGQSNVWLVGDVFLKNVYNAYDVKKLAVGLAQL